VRPQYHPHPTASSAHSTQGRILLHSYVGGTLKPYPPFKPHRDVGGNSPLVRRRVRRWEYTNGVRRRRYTIKGGAWFIILQGHGEWFMILHACTHIDRVTPMYTGTTLGSRKQLGAAHNLLLHFSASMCLPHLARAGRESVNERPKVKVTCLHVCLCLPKPCAWLCQMSESAYALYVPVNLSRSYVSMSVSAYALCGCLST
jgi:hypothetical protein